VTFIKDAIGVGSVKFQVVLITRGTFIGSVDRTSKSIKRAGHTSNGTKNFASINLTIIDSILGIVASTDVLFANTGVVLSGVIGVTIGGVTDCVIPVHVVEVVTGDATVEGESVGTEGLIV
jgi:hypothetical protein